MGRFFNNIKGQLGRDTGKAISGLVFGDKHATVYRRVNDSNSKKKETKKERKERLEEEEYLAELAVLEEKMQLKTEPILQQEIPQDKDLLIAYLTNIAADLHINGWIVDRDDETKILNNYPDTLYSKFKQGLFLLENSYPNSDRIPFLKGQLKKYRNIRFIKRHLFIILAGLFFAIIGIGVLISEMV